MTTSDQTRASRPHLFRADSVVHSLGVYLPATVAARFLGLVRGIALAWLMVEKREFGLFQIALLAVNILNPLCSIGLNEGVARYVPRYESAHSLRPFVRVALPMVLGIGLVLSAVAYLAAEPLGRFLFATLASGDGPWMTAGSQLNLTRLVAGITFALISYFLLLSILKGLRMFRAVSLMEFVNNTAFTLLAVVVALLGFWMAGAMLACYGITLVFVVLVFATPLKRLIRRADDQLEPLSLPGAGTPQSSVVRQMMRFSSWAALAAVMWQTLHYYPMWYLQKIHGPEVTAVYAGVRHLAQVVLIGAVAVVTVVQTSVTKTWESHGAAIADRNLTLAFKTTALLLLLGCMIVTMPSHVIIRLLPPGYADGATIMSLLLLSFLIAGLLAFLAIHFTLIEKTRYLFWPWTVGVVFNIAAGIWLIRSGLDATSALTAAAWVGVVGMSSALVTSLVLIWAEQRPLDVGSCLLIGLCYTLVLPGHVLVVVAGVLVIGAWTTNLIFDAQEKQRLGEYVAAGRQTIGRLISFRFRAS